MLFSANVSKTTLVGSCHGPVLKTVALEAEVAEAAVYWAEAGLVAAGWQALQDPQHLLKACGHFHGMHNAAHVKALLGAQWPNLNLAADKSSHSAITGARASWL